MRHGLWWEEAQGRSHLQGNQRMTAISTVGSKAQGVSFKEGGVSQGGKVGVRKRLLLFERPQRRQGYLWQAGVRYDMTKFLTAYLDS